MHDDCQQKAALKVRCCNWWLVIGEKKKKKDFTPGVWMTPSDGLRYSFLALLQSSVVLRNFLADFFTLLPLADEDDGVAVPLWWWWCWW